MTSKGIQTDSLVIKGLGLEKIEPGTQSKSTWNILNEDVSLPAAVLYQDKINNNLKWMQEFADHYGVKLCPHGKTTLCPYLFHQQIKSGAWGISLASASQVSIAYSFGISRILMVNQLIGKQNMEIISNILLSDPSFEFACLVDSPQNVKQIGQFFHQKNQKLRVLLEVGFSNGRCGARGLGQQYAVISEIQKYASSLSLIGLEFYEGIVKSETDVLNLATYVGELAQDLANRNAFDELPIIISAAGSGWFDIVADRLTSLVIKDSVTGDNVPLRIVLRPGSYLTHEVGTYADAKMRVRDNLPLLKEIGWTNEETMVTALQVWAYVQSVPKNGFVIVALGKRDIDASFDCQLPQPKLHYRPNVFQKPRVIDQSWHWQVTYVMDQHTFMEVNVDDDVDVGDMIAFEIYYPGTTLDKFRNLLLVDQDFNVVNVLKTYF